MQFINQTFKKITNATDEIISFIDSFYNIDKIFRAEITNNIKEFFKPLKKGSKCFY